MTNQTTEALAELAREALSDAESLGHPLCSGMQIRKAADSKAELFAAIAALSSQPPAPREAVAWRLWNPNSDHPNGGVWSFYDAKKWEDCKPLFDTPPDDWRDSGARASLTGTASTGGKE